MDQDEYVPEVGGDGLFKRLEEAFCAFEDLQDGFLAGLKERPLEMFNEMHWWEDERGKGCMLIKDLLSVFNNGLKCGIYPLDTAESWRTRIGRLIEKESMLYQALSLEKVRIVGELERLSKGRDALKGYQRFGLGGR
ncbi:hypothetical protein [Dissulfurimicrobium hydrothermale]|uniref:hypothetical protein n=1 Tax=Dissulfurimicrobium hydrothermale TaxID=1750598 RepID=UPI001ED9D7C0|nr:hypothetical protein [Dissulfurimicrobium hydrothermale]UKL12878.1 hypothetical protein LGS26_05120 [Dissulfurimicrobium hydrothermale]